MPNYFTLTRKSNIEAGPVNFATIDEEICAHLGVEVDNVHWYAGWYDNIGLMLAIGKSWNEMREIFKDSDALLPVIDFLEANFTANAWYQYGR